MADIQPFGKLTMSGSPIERFGQGQDGQPVCIGQGIPDGKQPGQERIRFRLLRVDYRQFCSAVCSA